MPKQMTLAALAHATKKKVTRREKFLTEMDAVVPWSRLLALMRTALPEDGQQGWATGDAFENHAAYLLPSAVGCAERSDGRGKPLRQRRYAPLRRFGTRR